MSYSVDLPSVAVSWLVSCAYITLNFICVMLIENSCQIFSYISNCQFANIPLWCFCWRQLLQVYPRSICIDDPSQQDDDQQCYQQCLNPVVETEWAIGGLVWLSLPSSRLFSAGRVCCRNCRQAELSRKFVSPARYNSPRRRSRCSQSGKLLAVVSWRNRVNQRRNCFPRWRRVGQLFGAALGPVDFAPHFQPVVGSDFEL